MVAAELGKQLMIRVEDHVGTLAEITNLVSPSGINLIAICAYAVGKTVAIMLVTDDNNGAKRLLQKKGYQVQEEEIILLTIDNKPGSLQKVTDKLAQGGIDLRLIYGSVDKGSENTRIVVITKNNLDAMMIIKTELERR